MVVSYKTSSFYWTGVAALVPQVSLYTLALLVPTADCLQTYLIFMSWEFIRNRYYETFKKLHFMYASRYLTANIVLTENTSASSIFMAALFIHCNFRLTSW